MPLKGYKKAIEKKVGLGLVGFFFSFSSCFALNYEQVIQTIRSHRIRSIPQLLQALASTDPTFFQSFTLARDSKSLQGSSPTHPRAIVFGPDAKFILTFNGSPEQAGYQTLEMMQFRETAHGGRFEFREIEFSKSGVRFSQANPVKCQRCHSFPLKPIWHPYPDWPGMYGELDDVIAEIEVRNSPLRPNNLEFMRQQVRDYRDFLQQKDAHPRYRWLRFHVKTPFPPYNSVERNGGEEVRPNLHLTHALNRLNSRVLAQRVFDSANHPTFLALVIEKMLGCFPSEDMTEGGSPLITEALALSQRAFPYASYLREQYVSSRSAPLPLIRLLNIENESLTLMPRATHWDYFDGTFHLDELLVRDLFVEAMKEIPQLQPFAQGNHYGYELQYGSVSTESEGDVKQRNCTVLHREALKRRANGWRLLPERKRSTRVVALCSSCHEQGGGPFIPFSNRSKVSQEWRERILARITLGHSSMPPNRNLMEAEKAELIRYLYQ